MDFDIPSEIADYLVELDEFNIAQVEAEEQGPGELAQSHGAINLLKET